MALKNKKFFKEFYQSEINFLKKLSKLAESFKTQLFIFGKRKDKTFQIKNNRKSWNSHLCWKIQKPPETFDSDASQTILESFKLLMAFGWFASFCFYSLKWEKSYLKKWISLNYSLLSPRESKLKLESDCSKLKLSTAKIFH